MKFTCKIQYVMDCVIAYFFFLLFLNQFYFFFVTIYV